MWYLGVVVVNWSLMENNIIREDLDVVIGYLKQDNPKLTNGPLVELFEKEWSEWLGCKYSVFVNSGSSANFITMEILKQKYGILKIMVSPLNWVSDIVSIIRAGHIPIFVDISLDTLGLDTDKLISVPKYKYDVVLVTHIMGYNAFTDEMLNHIDDKILIEDLCESHGATYKDKKLGTGCEISNFSFYYAHHMSTIEGGMISTNSKEFYDMACSFRSHGMAREIKDKEEVQKISNQFPKLNSDFIFQYPGYNMRSTEINALIGLSQLERIDFNIASRNKNNELFYSLLDSDKYIKPDITGASNYALVIIAKTKDLADKVVSYLRENDIEFRRGLSGGGNQLLQPYLKDYKYIIATDMENIEHVHDCGFYIGNYPGLETWKIERLCDGLNRL